MLVPIVASAIALYLGGKGVSRLIAGKRKLSEARDIVKSAENAYAKQYQYTLKIIKSFEDEVLTRIGKKKLKAFELRKKSIEILIRHIKRLKVKDLDLDKGKAISISTALKRLEDEKISLIETEPILEGIVESVGLSGAALASAKGIAIAIGTASTGIPISALKGEALRRAILAWFGGGSLAAGGGGMLLGSIVLGGIAVGPALFTLGSVLEKHAEKKLTEAKAYEAKIAVELKKLSIIRRNIIHFKRWLTGVYEKPLDKLLDAVETTIVKLEQLENQANISEYHLSLIKQLYLINRALREMLEMDMLNALRSISKTIEIFDKRLKEMEIQIDRILKENAP